MAAAVAPALDHAGIGAEDVDGIFVGVFNNGFSRQDFQAALVAMGDERFAHTPATRFENACATGSAASTARWTSSRPAAAGSRWSSAPRR
jgi:acetyl-CoA C-acetyltransferase